MRGPSHRACFSILVLLLATIGAAPARANDACAASGGTQTCAGDQSSGVSVINNGTTVEIDLNTLTKTITPASGVPVVDFEFTGGSGAAGNALTIKTDSTFNGTAQQTSGLLVRSTGGAGAGGSGGTFGSENGGSGGAGGAGGNIAITSAGTIATHGDNANAIDAETTGGQGGGGGGAFGLGTGGAAGAAGKSGTITIANAAVLSTDGANAHGIFALALGGAGNVGGTGGGGSGGETGGGDAQSVTINDAGAVTTSGTSASAIFGRSEGGIGSDGTTGGFGGAFGGFAGAVTITASSAINTTGATGIGIFADSVGGQAGNGEYNAGVVAFGGDGAEGGIGRAVGVDYSGTMSTSGTNADGIFARSIGGNGGVGANAGGVVAKSGSGGAGGSAGAVTVTLEAAGSIKTTGDSAVGISAESLGGTGGTGGNAGGVVGLTAGGGAGGSAGAVTVTDNGKISTAGSEAYGIFAESLGGSGGFGGVTGGVVAIGGEGGGGSKGGAVTITTAGPITTIGFKSRAVMALSIGGGGGVGSFAGGFVAVGGRGGTPSGACALHSADRTLCNDAGAVSLTNSGAITTSGDYASGLYAQSIGGGGGESDAGGNTVGAFAFGGSGGEGGDGNSVTVLNEAAGTITTSGIGARAILAQSIGGGGGNGGDALAPGVSAQVSVGGGGGGGGDAGTVSVENDAALKVTGHESFGIEAQSIGGGGGDGGDALSAGAAGATVSVGGSGGVGGDGGSVDVTNKGAIDIESDNAYGIYAQSVGGGGGNGGAGFSAGVSPVINFAVSVGGKGGVGGAGDAVGVTNSASIFTDGDDSVALYAESLGGGGGTGGAAAAYSGALQVPGAPFTFAAAVAVGGQGGAAGDSNTVTVTNTANITTIGDASHGIEAQSIGGGGGKGGDASSMAVALALKTSSIAVNVSVGGAGGAAGNGGAVTITDGGAISTIGQRSYGIFAQSVGGGGGEASTGGGSADQVNFRAGVLLKKLFSSVKATPGKAFEIGIDVGGNGGAAGNGSTATVVNTGSIVTEGYNAYGILAQSIGGGGGVGAAGTGDANQVPLTAGLGAAVGVGGNGGASGNGDKVTIRNSGTITTWGDDAAAIFGESVGGGGGISDTGANNNGVDTAGGGGGTGGGSGGLTGMNISVGGQGSSSGNGGEVEIDQNGNIVTHGKTSFGIFGQSVGGGGGVGGDAENTYSGKVNVGGGSGASGDGGEIDIAMNGNITTSGAGAHGIFAQSIGGGGGDSGDISAEPISVPGDSNLSFTVPFAGLVSAVQNAGAGGSGGVVNVTSNGTIRTTGFNADGILAQSIGGGGGIAGASTLSLITTMGSQGDGGVGAAVTVNHTGNIFATGERSSAIFAQSVGGTPNPNGNSGSLDWEGLNFNFTTVAKAGTGSDIDVTVAGGTYEGGSDIGAGIWLDNGLVNRVTIAQSATVEALSGTAIKVTANGGAVVNTVDNSGKVLGDVVLAGTDNGFINEANALLAPNTTIDLAGGVLTNSGTLSPGGLGLGAVVALNGTLNEKPGSVYVVDLGYGVATTDLINETGNATIAGTVSPHFTAILNVPSSTILTTTGTLTNAGATIGGNTVVVTFSLNFSAHALAIGTAADWDPAGLNANEHGVGAYLQDIWNAGGAVALAPAMGQLANITSFPSYADALDHLGPGSYLAVISGLGGNTTLFTDNLLSCHGANGVLSPISEEDCLWGEIGHASDRQSTTPSALGFSGRTGRVQIGGQRHIDADWVLGGSLGYDTWQRDVTGLAASNGSDIALGAVAKYLQGAWLNDAAIAIDAGTFDSARTITIPANTRVTGSSKLLSVDLRGRSAYLLDAGIAYVKPYADLDLGYDHMSGFEERGGGVLGLRVDPIDQFVATLSPMVEVGTTQEVADSRFLRPFLAGGLSLSSNNAWSISAGFEGAPPTVPDMTVKQDAHDVLGRVSAGVELLSTDSLLLRAQYDERFAGHYDDWDGVVKIGMQF